MEARILLRNIKKRKKTISLIKSNMALFSLLMGFAIFVIVGIANYCGKCCLLKEKAAASDANKYIVTYNEDDTKTNSVTCEIQNVESLNQEYTFAQFLDEYLNGEGCLIGILSCVATFFMCFQLPLMAEQSQTEFSHRIYEEDSEIRCMCEDARKELHEFCEETKKFKENKESAEPKMSCDADDSLQVQYKEHKILYKFAYHYEYLGFMLLKNKVDFNVLFDTITYPNCLMEGDAVEMIETYRESELSDFWTGSEFLYRSYAVRRTYDKMRRIKMLHAGDESLKRMAKNIITLQRYTEIPKKWWVEEWKDIFEMFNKYFAEYPKEQNKGSNADSQKKEEGTEDPLYKCAVDVFNKAKEIDEKELNELINNSELKNNRFINKMKEEDKSTTTQNNKIEKGNSTTTRNNKKKDKSKPPRENEIKNGNSATTEEDITDDCYRFINFLYFNKCVKPSKLKKMCITILKKQLKEDEKNWYKCAHYCGLH